jgi:hypothetical protein
MTLLAESGHFDPPPLESDLTGRPPALPPVTMVPARISVKPPSPIGRNTTEDTEY